MSAKVQTLLTDYPPAEILSALAARFVSLVELSDVVARLSPDLAPLHGFMEQLDGLTLNEKKRYFREVLMGFMDGHAVDIPMVPERMENRVFENVIDQTLDHMAGIVRQQAREQAAPERPLAPPA